MTNKLLYMTYDDAPVEDFIDKVDYLDSKGIKAIWYCQGNKLEEYMDLAVYAIKQGHVLGNHSYDHPHFSELTIEEARGQIARTEDLLEKAYALSGEIRPYKTFRFPYLDAGDGDTGDPIDFNHPHIKALQELLLSFGFVQPSFEGISYDWYQNHGFDRTISMECTYDSFDWVIGSEEPFLGYQTYEDILKRMDEDALDQGRGLNYDISNEIIMNHAFVRMDYFKGIVDKLTHVKGRFVLP